MRQIERHTGLAGNPRLGRTTRVARVPADIPVQDMVDLYYLIMVHREARRNMLSRPCTIATRNWVEYDRLMQSIDGVLGLDCNR